MPQRIAIFAIPVLLASTLQVQGSNEDNPPETQSSTQAATKSGYSQAPTLEGGDGVTADIAEDDLKTNSLFEIRPLKGALQPWYNFKKRLNDNIGLKLNFSYQGLYQHANPTMTGDNDAAAVRGQIQGAWTLFGRGTQNPGILTFRLENRNTVSRDIPPTSLGLQFGSITNTGTGFSDFGSALTELAWRQTFADGKLKVIGGKISAISWYNTHALSSSMRGFQNTGLQSSLSKPAPGRGFGFGIGVQPHPHFVGVAGIHDANAKTTGNPFKTIGDGEFFYSAEVRYYPTTPDRWKWDSLKLQFWHQDARVNAGTSASTGITFQASRLFDDRWYPFALGGISDGNASIFKADLMAGLGIAIDTKNRAARDVFGVALGWGNPSNDRLQDQFTAEMFYRAQITSAFAVTPAVQLINNPAANPKDDHTLVWSLRSRITF